MDFQTIDCRCSYCNADKPHLVTWAGCLCTTCGTRSGSKPQKRIVADNGTDGYNCEKCRTFCAYVEPNQPTGGYVCPDCRGAGNLT